MVNIADNPKNILIADVPFANLYILYRKNETKATSIINFIAIDVFSC